MQGCKAIGVEANPVLVKAREKKFSKALANGQLTIVNKEIANVNGHLDFCVNL